MSIATPCPSLRPGPLPVPLPPRPPLQRDPGLVNRPQRRRGARPRPACPQGTAGGLCPGQEPPNCVSPPQQFMEIEPEMLAMETIVPVYFAVEDEALLSIYEQTQAASASQGSASAAEGALGRGQGRAVPPRGCCLRASMWRPSSP